MQDVQNIPPPDTTSNNENEEFGSHSSVNPKTQESGVETPGSDSNVGKTPSTNRDSAVSIESVREEDENSDLM